MVAGADPGLSQRRHRARQVRARIVELAREYAEAFGQHEAASAFLSQDVRVTQVMRDEEQRTWDAMEQRREALFGALGELEMLEEGET